MHLRARKNQIVRIPAENLLIEFAEGETIWTESGHKYSIDEIPPQSPPTPTFVVSGKGSMNNGRSRKICSLRNKWLSPQEDRQQKVGMSMNRLAAARS